ncbi:MAG: type II toxin-antitoxin system RelE/ParE family toxin [Robiginitomaculum sp.]|nr:type II toxin-antitoxin system RelE/ParE family toxin [Robiginitomaculum sp.]
MAKLIRTRQAEIDLLEIWAFIAEENTMAADELVRKLDARSHQLLEHPNMGVQRHDIVNGMRHLAVGNYLILYRIKAGDIEIIRYLHGARDLFSL